MSPRLAVVAIAAAALAAATLDASATPRPRRADSELKIKVAAPRRKTPAGELATLRVKVKNRTALTRDVTVTLHTTAAPETPFSVQDLTLDPKEKRTLLVDVTVPADFAERKLRVIARAEQLEDGANVKVRPAPLTEEQLQRGRELYRSRCVPCHDAKGGDVRGDSLSRWVQAMRGGPGSMPTYRMPTSDIRLMRAYTRKPGK